jgi:hypothetical protein
MSFLSFIGARKAYKMQGNNIPGTKYGEAILVHRNPNLVRDILFINIKIFYFAHISHNMGQAQIPRGRGRARV